jgi:hypothetical protein
VIEYAVQSARKPQGHSAPLSAVLAQSMLHLKPWLLNSMGIAINIKDTNGSSWRLALPGLSVYVQGSSRCSAGGARGIVAANALSIQDGVLRLGVLAAVAVGVHSILQAQHQAHYQTQHSRDCQAAGAGCKTELCYRRTQCVEAAM